MYNLCSQRCQGNDVLQQITNRHSKRQYNLLDWYQEGNDCLLCCGLLLLAPLDLVTNNTMEDIQVARRCLIFKDKWTFSARRVKNLEDQFNGFGVFLS